MLNGAALTVERGVDLRRAIADAAMGLRRDRYHRYWYSPDWTAGDDRDARRDIELYGVTSIIGCLDKSGALTTWAARTQYDADELAAYRLYQKELPADLSEEHFRTLFRAESDGAAVFKKQRDAAADFGTSVHALVEHRVGEMLGGDAPEPPASDDALRLFAAWERWAEDASLAPYAAEFLAFDPETRVAGSPDFLGCAYHTLTVTDWKTGNGIYVEAYLQNVAYRKLLAIRGVTDGVAAGCIVRLPKKPGDGVEVHRLTGDELIVLQTSPAGRLEEVRREPLDTETLWHVFLSLRDVYPWKKEEDRKSYAEWKRRKGLAK